MNKSYDTALKEVTGLKPKLAVILKDIDKRLKKLEEGVTESNSSDDDSDDEGLGEVVLSNGVVPSLCLVSPSSTNSWATKNDDGNFYLDSLYINVWFKDENDNLLECNETNFEKFCMSGTPLPNSADGYYYPTESTRRYEVYLKLRDVDSYHIEIVKTALGSPSTGGNGTPLYHGYEICSQEIYQYNPILVPNNGSEEREHLELSLEFIDKENGDTLFELNFDTDISYSLSSPNAPSGVILFE